MSSAMDSIPSEGNLTVTIENLQISSDALNPWQDEPSNDDKALTITEERPHTLHTPDPSTLDESVAKGLEVEAQSESEPTATTQPLQEVLNEFDPLAHQEEKDAREAWENAEAHPAPPQTPSPPPTPPTITAPTLPIAPSPSSFTSLAAFARSFAIPGLPRPRPLSIDTAKSVPSPATLSSFAEQQQEPQKSSADGVAVPSVEDTTRGGSGGKSLLPEPGQDQKKENVETPFDFQKFLDQMKMKGAEPISKYLKSCVLLSFPVRVLEE
jgi:Rab5 GDP/GTP exchange factor